MGKILLIGGCGYVGSYLFQALRQWGCEVDICDPAGRDAFGEPVRFARDYAALTAEELAPYSTLLWFANVTSRLMPMEALQAYCLRLVDLTRKMAPGTRLVYAGHAHLYANGKPYLSKETELIPITGKSGIDMSRLIFDQIANNFLPGAICLRLGAVCGYSPCLRPELIFNRMNLMAMESGRVEVWNMQSYRALLFLSDLAKVVRQCVTLTDIPAGIFNVASVNLPISEIADCIAAFHQAKVIARSGLPTHSYMVDVEKAEKCFAIEFDDDLQRQCGLFRDAIRRFRLTGRAACHLSA